MACRILLIGDLHFRPIDREQNLIMVEELLEIIYEIKPDAVVVLGDTLDTHDNFKGGPHSLAVRFFREISLITKLILLIGNHDIKNNEVDLSLGKEDHPFIALEYWENTILVDHVRVFEINEHMFCGVPYLPPGRYLDAIKHINQENITAFFSHQGFNGAYYQPGGKPITDGDNWPSHCKVNFCGHFHEFHVVKDNLIYVGTPTTTDHGASYDKAIMLVTFTDNYYSYERIKLQKITMRITYRVEAKPSCLKEIINEINSHDTRCIYKVVIYGKSQALSSIKRSLYYKELDELAKITEESVGAELVICKGISDEVILDGDYDQILRELLIPYPEELAMYEKIFK